MLINPGTGGGYRCASLRFILFKTPGPKLSLPWYSSGIDNFVHFWYAESGGIVLKEWGFHLLMS